MHKAARVPTRSLVGLAVVVAAHWIFLVSGLPGGVVVSDGLFVVAPAWSAWRCAVTAGRLEGRARTCWTGFAVVGSLWAAGNLVWGWYEVVLERPVPNPSPADWFYFAALAVGVGVALAGLLPLVRTRSGAARVALDCVLVVGSLLFLAWTTVFGPMLDDDRAEVVQTVTWLFPALGVTASTVAFATMSRVPARFRLPWLVLGVGFLAGAVVDTAWAHANVTGGWMTGTLLDPLWVASYLLLGVSALAVRGDGGLTGSRLVAARWESLAPYVPVAAGLAAAFVQQLRGNLTEAMSTAGMAMVGLLVLRQVVAILENHALAHDLESRVADATAELRASEEHFRSIVGSISDLVLLLDDTFTITYQSPAAGRLLGYGPGELVGRGIDAVAHAEDLAAAQAASAAIAGTAGRTEQYLARFRHQDGTWCHMEATVTDLLDHPEVHGIVLALRDVGDRVELQERLHHQAFHDSLTGLANRALLYQELDALLAAGRLPSLLLLDLDEFKAVNDTAGHDLGDEVLVAVAQRLLESTRPGDLVSRLGGDEFAIVLQDDPRSHAAVAIADRILHTLRLPLRARGREVRCLGSIGVASSDGSSTAAGLLRDADVAMYVAKANGKGRIELFTPAMRESVVRRQRVEELLRRAVADRRLLLEFQPVLDLAEDRFVGAEALLRLRGDGGELLSPVEFIPVAEETGLIVELGNWVLVEACRRAASWQALRPDGPPFDVAVNVSTRQLQDPSLARSVAAALDAADLPAGLLTLEITEGALAVADPDVDGTLQALRMLGVRLSIDDFGAGYSSLGRLRHLPVDELKIDRSFVAELAGPGNEAPLIEAILAMAARLGLSVVAEGIETIEQAVYLRVASCHRGQGFLYARPMSAEAVAVTLAGSPAEERARVR